MQKLLQNHIYGLLHRYVDNNAASASPCPRVETAYVENGTTKLPYIVAEGKIVNMQANETAFKHHMAKIKGNKLPMRTLSAASSFDGSNKVLN